jgi:acyl-[acyl-carrier-protein]-phospholipid O-acyltransferase/long-chain-fatty-acid--[acyl-carrier-protein] ligase
LVFFISVYFYFLIFNFSLHLSSVNQTKSNSGSRRGFWFLFVTQFQGAFSDNALKNLVVFMFLGLNLSLAEKHEVAEKANALFSLPFILFSFYGGFMADRFSKRTVTIAVKIFEIIVMSFVCAALAWQNRQILLAGIFCMGVHSAFFGPSKYGLLPELLTEKKLSWGNGWIEFGTYTAIILGGVAAALMHSYFSAHPAWSGIILITLALVGLGASLGISRVPAADPALKFQDDLLGQIIGRLRSVGRDRSLSLAFLGNTYFNFLGALLLLNIFFYATYVLHVGDLQISYLSIALALGIGFGSVAAGYASGGKIEHGLIPYGAFGLSIISAVLAVPGWSLHAALAWLALLGFTGGFFIVPVSAILQYRPEPSKKGEVLAAANWLSFVGSFIASAVYYVLTGIFNLSPLEVFLFGGILTFVGAILVLVLSPDSLCRAFLWLMTHTLYRLRVEGLENLPRHGGALLISNHVSFVDWLLLMAAADRPVRFLMGKDYYDKFWVRPFASVPRVIPIPPEIRPREVIQALHDCGRAILNGDVVCIFAEGALTRTGQMRPFHRGFEHVMKGTVAGSPGGSPPPVIVPAALIGLWGSIFSFEGGKVLWKRPRQFPRLITVRFGNPLPPTATPNEVQSVVERLMQ